jgi:hypothetical protein
VFSPLRLRGCSQFDWPVRDETGADFGWDGEIRTGHRTGDGTRTGTGLWPRLIGGPAARSRPCPTLLLGPGLDTGIGTGHEGRDGTRGSGRDTRVGTGHEGRDGTRGSGRDTRVGTGYEGRDGTRGSGRDTRVGTGHEDRDGTRGSGRDTRIGTGHELGRNTNWDGTRGSGRDTGFGTGHGVRDGTRDCEIQPSPRPSPIGMGEAERMTLGRDANWGGTSARLIGGPATRSGSGPTSTFGIGTGHELDGDRGSGAP